jgi:hypothetical protein
MINITQKITDNSGLNPIDESSKNLAAKSNWLTRYYKKSNYAILFNQVNGTFIRIGKNNIDPFYNHNGPELLDI